MATRNNASSHGEVPSSTRDALIFSGGWVEAVSGESSAELTLSPSRNSRAAACGLHY